MDVVRYIGNPVDAFRPDYTYIQLSHIFVHGAEAVVNGGRVMFSISGSLHEAGETSCVYACVPGCLECKEIVKVPLSELNTKKNVYQYTDREGSSRVRRKGKLGG